MPSTTTPSASTAQSQSPKQTTKPARRRRTTTTGAVAAPTEARSVPPPAVTVLPAGFFSRTGGAELSPTEHLLVENFRQMNGGSRDVVMKFTTQVAADDRAKRMQQNGAGLRLVKGGAK